MPEPHDAADSAVAAATHFELFSSVQCIAVLCAQAQPAAAYVTRPLSCRQAPEEPTTTAEHVDFGPAQSKRLFSAQPIAAFSAQAKTAAA